MIFDEANKQTNKKFCVTILPIVLLLYKYGRVTPVYCICKNSSRAYSR